MNDKDNYSCNSLYFHVRLMKYLICFTLFSALLTGSCTTDKHPKKVTEIVKELSVSSRSGARFPMLFASENRLLMSWTEKHNDSLSSIYYSDLQDTLWSPPKKISEGFNRFVNWADFPAIVENKGNLLSYALEKSADGTYTYDIKMKLKKSGSERWSDSFILHNDGTKSEHGFVSMIPADNDAFFLSWLDGRNTTGSHNHHGGDAAMTLRAAFVKSTGEVTRELELDAKTCDCCQTSVAMTQNGPVVVYRDRYEDETRDISIRRYQSGNWTSAQRVFPDNWKIAGCPVNGPKVISRDNVLAILWYTAADNRPTVKLIFSEDNGQSFSEPVVIDTVTTIGRVDIDFIDNQSVLLSWVSSQVDRTTLSCVKVNKDGQLGEAFEVTTLDPSRASGFPQLEIFRDRAYFAWTKVSDTMTEVKTAYIDLDNL